MHLFVLPLLHFFSLSFFCSTQGFLLRDFHVDVPRVLPNKLVILVSM